MQTYLDDFREADNHDQWQRALEVAQQATIAFPRDARAHAMQARALMQIDELALSRRAVAEALSFDRQCALAIATEAALLDLDGKRKEALARLDAAIAQLPPHPSLFIARGWQRRESGDLDGALADFQQAAALDPQGMRAHVNAAAILSDQGRSRDAAEFWHDAATRNPRVGQLAYNAGTALYKEQDYGRAIAHLDRAREKLGDRNDVMMNRAATLQELGRHQEAIDEWLPLYRREPHWDWVLLGLGKSFYRVGDEPAARRYFSELDRLSGDHEGTVQLGWLLFHDRKSAELIALVEPLAKARHSRPEFGQMMGMSLRRTERHAEALSWMERTLAANEDYHYVRGDLANLLSGVFSRHEEGLKHIRIALEQSPSSPFYRRVHAEILERMNGSGNGKPAGKGGWIKRLFGG